MCALFHNIRCFCEHWNIQRTFRHKPVFPSHFNRLQGRALWCRLCALAAGCAVTGGCGVSIMLMNSYAGQSFLQTVERKMEIGAFSGLGDSDPTMRRFRSPDQMTLNPRSGRAGNWTPDGLWRSVGVIETTKSRSRRGRVRGSNGSITDGGAFAPKAGAGRFFRLRHSCGLAQG